MDKKIKAIDLFAGAGGFSLGMQNAGFDVYAKIEVDEWACDTLRHNFSDSRVYHRDITSFSDNDISKEFSIGADIIIGGPPCQGYSLCRRGKGEPADPRNRLVFEFLRFVNVLQPSVFIMENVANLIRAKNQNGELVRDVLKEEIEALGYAFNIRTLNAAYFGVPQKRERCFIIGSKADLKSPFPPLTHSLDAVEDLFADLSKTPTLIEAIGDLPVLEAGQGDEISEYADPPATSYQQRMRGECTTLFNHKAMNHTKRMVQRFQSMSCGQSASDVADELKPRKRNSTQVSQTVYDQNNRRLHADKPSNTIPASFYANFVHPFQHRNFTAREGARIQSFPDHFRFLGKPTLVSSKLLEREGRTSELHLCQYNQIGNSVPPLLAQALGEHLKDII